MTNSLNLVTPSPKSLENHVVSVAAWGWIYTLSCEDPTLKPGKGG